MDLRTYYKQMREIEATMPAPFVVMASLATPDGGKTGALTEVSAAIAARMILEGSGREATETEATAFHESQAEARREAEEIAVASRLQVVVVPGGAAKPPVRLGKEL